METEDNRGKAQARLPATALAHAYQPGSMGQGSAVQSPENVISGFHEHSQGATLLQMSGQPRRLELASPKVFENAPMPNQMLSPPTVADSQAASRERLSDRSRSVNSGGSVVGRNQVFIPNLSFPEDINADPREKRRTFAKPEDSRFALKKTTNSQQPGQAKKFGKKGKLLEIKLQSQNNELQEEPVEDERPAAARGERRQEEDDIPPPESRTRQQHKELVNMQKLSFLQNKQKKVVKLVQAGTAATQSSRVEPGVNQADEGRAGQAERAAKGSPKQLPAAVHHASPQEARDAHPAPSD